MERTILTSLSENELESILMKCLEKTLQSNQLQNYKEPVIQTKDLLSRKETADILGISLPTLNTYTKTGLLPCLKIGKSVRYRFDDITKSLAKKRQIC